MHLFFTVNKEDGYLKIYIYLYRICIYNIKISVFVYNKEEVYLAGRYIF